MSNYDPEQRRMDLLTEKLRFASILQAVGWTLLLFNAITVNFIFVGFRSGTYFWLYWTIIEGAIGFMLVMAGSYLKAQAGHELPDILSEEDTDAQAA